MEEKKKNLIASLYPLLAVAFFPHPHQKTHTKVISIDTRRMLSAFLLPNALVPKSLLVRGELIIPDVQEVLHLAHLLLENANRLAQLGNRPVLFCHNLPQAAPTSRDVVVRWPSERL